MIITQTTLIGFKVPDEYPQMVEFERLNNLNEWDKSSSTEYVYFIKLASNHFELTAERRADE